METIYTCPMHPEIKQPHPGHCPKCGMSLVLVEKINTSTKNQPTNISS